ncbi:hypothetical protein BCR34DRAFT_597102 [Clohesyomyces aquaticus]|uniref:Uncharacterized protein n=1 Tax=Clohesyomyces aquaticus TaxID=1231657 RepID=A0A1Y2A458_9PLEO|nr:hypothetical protein BCR34DRAFT_597102 [Clohesyomyces aquaticus]
MTRGWDSPLGVNNQAVTWNDVFETPTPIGNAPTMSFKKRTEHPENFTKILEKTVRVPCTYSRKTCLNVVYGFVNFRHTDRVLALLNNVGNRVWPGHASNRPAEASYATVQGLDALVKKFKNSCAQQVVTKSGRLLKVDIIATTNQRCVLSLDELFSRLKAHPGHHKWRREAARNASQTLIQKFDRPLKIDINEPNQSCVRLLDKLIIKAIRIISFRMRMSAVKWSLLWPVDGDAFKADTKVSQSRHFFGIVAENLCIMTKDKYPFRIQDKEIVHKAMAHLKYVAGSPVDAGSHHCAFRHATHHEKVPVSVPRYILSQRQQDHMLRDQLGFGSAIPIAPGATETPVATSTNAQGTMAPKSLAEAARPIPRGPLRFHRQRPSAHRSARHESAAATHTRAREGGTKVSVPCGSIEAYLGNDRLLSH